MHIRKETGHWFISKKAIWAQAQFTAIGRAERENVRPRPLKKQTPVEKPFGIPPQVKTFIRYLPFTVYHYLRAYHFTLWFFLFFGLFRKRQKGLRDEWFLVSLVLFHVCSLATFIPSTIRFSVPLVPVSLFWAAAGVLEFERFLKTRNAFHPDRWIFCVIVIILLVQLPQIARPDRRHREDQKTVGAWLRQNTPDSAEIMSNSPQQAFDAIRRFVPLPPGRRSYHDVVHLAKEKGVRYILTDKNTRETSPEFMDSIPSPDVKEVYRYQNRKGDITALYEVHD